MTSPGSPPGEAGAVETAPPPRRGRVPPLAWVSLVVVYIAWGSTYVAIRVAVREVPPLTLAGMRYLVAGLILWPFAVRSGGPSLRAEDRPGVKQWVAAGLVGILLLFGGNGGVTVGEQRVPAGLAALLVATVPLWMAVGGRVLFGARVGVVTAVALAIGIVGVALVVRPAGGSRGDMLLVLGAAAVWGLGSVASPHLPLPRRVLVTSSIEMLVGGTTLLAVGAATGELGRLRPWNAATLWAMLFLIFGGSLLGFSAYAHVLSRLPLPLASTYAYVNPLVAVLLGWALLGETLTVADALGAALILMSVVLVVAARTGSLPFSRRAATPRSRPSGGGPGKRAAPPASTSRTR